MCGDSYISCSSVLCLSAEAFVQPPPLNPTAKIERTSTSAMFASLFHYGIRSAEVTGLHSPPSYAASIAVVDVTNPPRRVVVKWSKREPALAARITNQSHLIAHCARDGEARTAALLLPLRCTAPFVEQAVDNTLMQLFEYVSGPHLHAVLRGAPDTAAFNSICHSFGAALGALDRQLASAGSATPSHARVPLAALDTLATRAVAASLGGVGNPKRSRDHGTAVPDDELRGLGEWDLRSVSSLRASALPAVAASLRPLVEAALDEVDAVLVPLFERSTLAAATGVHSLIPGELRMQWIHGDANDMNVIVNKPASSEDGSTASLSPACTPADVAAAASDPLSLVFIDWDDAAFGFTAADPAIALAYVMMAAAPEGNAAADAAVAFLHGYAQTYALTATEVAALPGLIRARLAASLLMSSRTAVGMEGEQREYVLLHAEPAAALLRRLVGVPTAAATTAVAEAAVEGGVAAIKQQTPLIIGGAGAELAPDDAAATATAAAVVVVNVNATKDPGGGGGGGGGTCVDGAGATPTPPTAHAPINEAELVRRLLIAAGLCSSHTDAEITALGGGVYRPCSLPLSSRQAAASTAVLEGLAWMSAGIHPVVTLGDTGGCRSRRCCSSGRSKGGGDGGGAGDCSCGRGRKGVGDGGAANNRRSNGVADNDKHSHVAGSTTGADALPHWPMPPHV